MKVSAAILVSLACAVGLAAQSAGSSTTAERKKSRLPRIVLPSDASAARNPAPAPKASGTVEVPAQPVVPASPAPASAKADASKKDEKPPKIEGVEIPRGEKGFLGIQIVESSFKLSFYDSKKKPVPPDVDRAALRWDPKYKVGTERVVLTLADDGKALSSEKNIRPPYLFKLFITLVKDAKEGTPPVNETFTVDFRQ